MSTRVSCISITCCEQLFVVKSVWLAYVWPVVTGNPCPLQDRDLLASPVRHLGRNPSELMKV